jgi:hypothetical protein
MGPVFLLLLLLFVKVLEVALAVVPDAADLLLVENARLLEGLAVDFRGGWAG